MDTVYDETLRMTIEQWLKRIEPTVFNLETCESLTQSLIVNLQKNVNLKKMTKYPCVKFFKQFETDTNIYVYGFSHNLRLFTISGKHFPS